jgi:hypothetical protein
MMKMAFAYERLAKNAAEARAELSRKGLFDPGKGKIRKKPRTPEKIEMLYRRALGRAREYKPYYDQDGCLILPYFYGIKRK